MSTAATPHACYEYRRVTEEVPEGYMILRTRIGISMKERLEGKRVKIVEKIVPAPLAIRRNGERGVASAYQREAQQPVANGETG